MDKKSKNSGKFSTTSTYSHKQENSVQRRLKRPDQAFYSGGGTNNGANNGNATTNVTSPTNAAYNDGTRDSGYVVRGRGDKKPPLAAPTSNVPSASAMQLPPNCPSNIESMPPRFQRKWLQENNLPLDFFEMLASNQQQQQQQQPQAPPSQHNRSQTLPNKGHASRGIRNNYGNYGGGGNYGNNGNKNHGGRPLRSPMRSRSRSSDQRGSRHSSRNSSLERGTRIFSNSKHQHPEPPSYDNQRRHGTRSPDYRRDSNKNYGNKGSWTSKQNYYGNKSMEQSDNRREIADLPPRSAQRDDPVIFVSHIFRIFFPFNDFRLLFRTGQ